MVASLERAFVKPFNMPTSRMGKSKGEGSSSQSCLNSAHVTRALYRAERKIERGAGSQKLRKKKPTKASNARRPVCHRSLTSKIVRKKLRKPSFHIPLRFIILCILRHGQKARYSSLSRLSCNWRLSFVAKLQLSIADEQTKSENDIFLSLLPRAPSQFTLSARSIKHP